MHGKLVFAVCMVVASPVLGCDPRMNPPAQFDHEPTVAYRIFRWDAEMLASVCEAEGYANLGGCAEQVSDDFWFIYIVDNASHPECVIRHEFGHVNGWEHPVGFGLVKANPPR